MNDVSGCHTFAQKSSTAAMLGRGVAPPDCISDLFPLAEGISGFAKDTQPTILFWSDASRLERPSSATGRITVRGIVSFDIVSYHTPC